MADFQKAAQAVVDGDVETLQVLVQQQPALVTERSPKHGATLLHYVGANGPIEDEMQKTPLNAVEIAKLLLDCGSEVDATIDDNPGSTPLVALVTSEFPAAAGLQAKLVELFVESGAAVDGVNVDGYPLACAMCFQYPDAIRALLNCGARVDNLVAAASLGRLEYVKNCFDAGANLLPEKTAYPDPFMRSFDPKQVVEIAMEHASKFEQKEVVDFLTPIVNAD